MWIDRVPPSEKTTLLQHVDGELGSDKCFAVPMFWNFLEISNLNHFYALK